MKSNDQAALDLFSNYSEFMLTDDELLIIHGGTTNSGSGHSGGGSGGSGGGEGSTSAPAAPPPSPPLQAPVVQVQPVTGHVNVDVGQSATRELAVAVHEITHEVVDIVHDLHTSGPVQAVGNFITAGINAANNALFGQSSSSGGGSGG